MLVITFFMATMGYGNDAFAQDATTQELGLSENEREKMIYSPGEGETKYKVGTGTPTKDSVTVVRPQTPVAPLKTKPETLKAPEKSTGKDDSQESILSFNFLYYIIQKYKLQDIVD